MVENTHAVTDGEILMLCLEHKKHGIVSSLSILDRKTERLSHCKEQAVRPFGSCGLLISKLSNLQISPTNFVWSFTSTDAVNL